MNLPTREPLSPAALAPHSGAMHAEAALWHHGIHTFLRELDALVAAGRIDPDARNVILWTLKRAVPLVERGGEGRPEADSCGRERP